MDSRAAVVLAFAVIFLGTMQAFAEDKVVKGPGGLSIRCSDFTKRLDGSWWSGWQATLAYPHKPDHLRITAI
jgi:hypothetical protein